MNPRHSPGRTIEAAVIRRLYYDMSRYRVVQEYLRAREYGYQTAARVSKRRLERTHEFVVRHSHTRLDTCARKIESDLDALHLEIEYAKRYGPVWRTTLDRPFSESPEYLKSFDLF